MEKAERISPHFGEFLGIWFDTHELIKENADLLAMAAETLHRDLVIGAEFWEEELLLSQKAN